MEEDFNLQTASVEPKKRKHKKPFVNNSGQNSPHVPAVIKNKFNWGACLLNWIWGIGNKVYIPFLMFIVGWIPFVNLGLIIWFGIKGNEWAWKKKRFQSVKHFHEYQKKWAAVAVVLYVISFVAGICMLVVSSQMVGKHPETFF